MNISGVCNCPAAKYYTAPTSQTVPIGTCTRCNDTSYIASPSLNTTCNLCPLNMKSRGGTTCTCEAPFIPDGRNSCKCPPGHFYIAPKGNNHIGQCQICNSTSILINTAGYIDECNECPPNMYADGNRTKWDCEQSFIKDNNQQCMCNRGYYYTPGTNGLPGNCQKCNDTSILVTPGLTQECNRCKANQYSNNDCIDCFCAPGFTKNKDGTCVCPGGFRYVRGSKGLPG